MPECWTSRRELPRCRGLLEGAGRGLLRLSFEWLYARGRGGKMLLRIEDTDRERSTEAAIGAILDGLKWLGIDWDGETIYQFARAARHRAPRRMRRPRPRHWPPRPG